MSEIIVENKVCLECGVKSRSGSLFCYNCGSSVSPNNKNIGEDSNGDGQTHKEVSENKIESDVIVENDEKKEDLTEPQTSEVLKDSENLESTDEDLLDEKIKIPTFDEPEIEEPVIENTENIVEEKFSENIVKTKIAEPKPIKTTSRLRSASALRQKSKSLNTKKVEVIWEERQTAPNLMFIIVSIFLIISALVLFYLAMYLK